VVSVQPNEGARHTRPVSPPRARRPRTMAPPGTGLDRAVARSIRTRIRPTRRPSRPRGRRPRTTAPPASVAEPRVRRTGPGHTCRVGPAS